MGGSEEVKGYPVPAGADNSVFPYDSAATVVLWGDRAGNALVREMVDTVRDWLGHPETVNTYAHKWGVSAKGAMAESADGINSALLDVKAYWQGAAFDSFAGYIGQVQSVVTANTKVLADMGDLVQNMHKVMTETYMEGIRFIGDCAKAVINAASTIAANWAKLWGAVAEGILIALRDFVDNVSRLSQKALDLMDQYSKSAHDIESTAIDLKIPDTMPASAGESGSWKIKPA